MPLLKLASGPRLVTDICGIDIRTVTVTGRLAYLWGDLSFPSVVSPYLPPA